MSIYELLPVYLLQINILLILLSILYIMDLFLSLIDTCDIGYPAQYIAISVQLCIYDHIL
jgi:hypothetical protein